MNNLETKNEKENDDKKNNLIKDKDKDNDELIFSNNDEKKDNIKISNTFNLTNKMNKTKTSLITTSTHSNNFYKKNNVNILSLEELKEKFESININKEKLFNYNSKLTSNLNQRT